MKTMFSKTTIVGALVLCFAASLASAQEWSYQGESGPEHWGSLAPQYAQCSQGRNQSPVDIKVAEAVNADLQPVKFNYGMMIPDKMVNTGKAIRIEMGMGTDIEVDGISFELQYFEFHTPSETTVNGKSFPMEAQFVHKSKDGEHAIVSIMFVPGEGNRTVNKLWQQLPMQAGTETRLASKALRSLEMSKKLSNFYRYNGSLTTPPCSEGVRWFVMKDPMRISSAQLELFQKALGAPNNRPVQPLHARQILE